MLSWLASGALSSIISGFVNPLMNYLGKRADVNLQKYLADTGLTRDAALETLRNDAIVKTATKDIILSALTHPIWWVLWFAFVLPVASYEASIFYVSILDARLNTPGCYIPSIGETLRLGGQVCEYFVRRVPSAQEDLARLIVQSIFLAQTGTGATAGLVHAITARLRK